jgi:hypothetical protein
MDYKYFLFSIVLIIILVFYTYTGKYTKPTQITYCKYGKNKNNTILQELLDNNDIKKNNYNWDLYIPSTYTYIESELRKLTIHNKDQKIFGISGCDKMVAKDNLWYFFRKKLGRREALKYLPATYILKNPDDCILFRKEYSPRKIYLLKKNIQRKLGIKLTRDKNEILNCKEEGYVVAQKYIENLYLINKRKINLRIYLLVVSEGGINAWYVSRLGKCIYTNKDFKNDSLEDPEVHLTSLNLSEDIYKNLPLSLHGLWDYLGTENYSILFKRILNLMKKCKYVFDDLLGNSKNSNTHFQLFGVDIVFTNLMMPYLLELNKGPQMKPINNLDYKIKEKIYRDIFNKIGIRLKTNKKNSFIKI